MTSVKYKHCYFSENSMHPQCHVLWDRKEALREALQNIINGVNTGAIRVETDKDERWVNAIYKAKQALGLED